MPSGGGEAVQVTKNGGDYGRESPDGKWIYYAKTVGNSLRLWKMPAGGGEEKQIEPGPLSYWRNFVVMDDGIYFTKAGGTLEFLDFKSGRSRAVARDKRWLIGLAISPDHHWILASILDQTFNDLMLVENFR